ncbi:MAG: hypothetical protein RLZZ165_1027 [Bacteroidota bacterium]|jgi:transposase-like protein
MKAKRKHYNAEFKARVALEALRGDKTLAELASEFSVPVHRVSAWKRHLPSRSGDLFKMDGTQDAKNGRLIADLYRRIGKVEREREWLEKVAGAALPGAGDGPSS